MISFTHWVHLPASQFFFGTTFSVNPARNVIYGGSSSSPSEAPLDKTSRGEVESQMTVSDLVLQLIKIGTSCSLIFTVNSESLSDMDVIVSMVATASVSLVWTFTKSKYQYQMGHCTASEEDGSITLVEACTSSTNQEAVSLELLDLPLQANVWAGGLGIWQTIMQHSKSAA